MPRRFEKFSQALRQSIFFFFSLMKHFHAKIENVLEPISEIFIFAKSKKLMKVLFTF